MTTKSSPQWWADLEGYWRDEVLKDLVKYGVQVYIGVTVAVGVGVIDRTDARANALGVAGALIYGPIAYLWVYLAVRPPGTPSAVVSTPLIVMLIISACIVVVPPASSALKLFVYGTQGVLLFAMAAYVVRARWGRHGVRAEPPTPV
jgi:hypothetical protein